MRKLFVLASLLMAVLAQAEEQFLGIYMGGNKIGYSSYNTHPDMYGDQKVVRTDSKTVLDASLLAAALKMRMEGTTWANSAGKPLKMTFMMTSSGRTQKIVALFNSKTVEIDVTNGGQKNHMSLPIPGDGTIVDDPLELVVAGKIHAGGKKTIYVLDPTTVSFMKTDVVVVGPGSTTINGKKVTGTLVQIVDPRITMDVYISAKGDLIKAEAIGMVMVPETRAMALNNTAKPGYQPSTDLAFATKITTDKKITDPADLTGLTLRLTGKDLSRLPSDEHQSVKKEGTGWVIDVHPPKLPTGDSLTIAEVGKQKPEWLKPTLNIPSNSSTFKELSATVLKGETKVIPAALAVRGYVYSIMRPNAGIGVLRDATEVLSSKEGVCRDYAILTATLMRASGIPARLASGVVNWQGDFFYHAWVEIWDGSKWIGVDSTVPQKQMSASHVKLADGNVEDAFAFTFLDKVKIEVLDIRRN
jgi:hypothetical protein